MAPCTGATRCTTPSPSCGPRSGHDTKNEVLIFTATGDQWINDVDASSFKDIEDSPDNVPRFNVQIYDTLKVVENFVNDIEIPTICAITGQGIHWEMAMMSDITLCTPDFVLQDDHFVHAGGHVPGDGMTLALQYVLGIKRGNYMSLMNKGLDAETCLRLGAVNEVVERDKIDERAWEIARHLMKTNRSTRRLSHHVVRAPLAGTGGAEHPPARLRRDVLVQPGEIAPRLRHHRVLRRQDGEDVETPKEEEITMAMQPYVHVETLEEYSERFKDFAHLERTEDGILLCRLHWKGEACVWSYQTQMSYGELWTAIGHDKQNEIVILTCEDPYWITQRSDPDLLRRSRGLHRPRSQVQLQRSRHHELRRELHQRHRSARHRGHQRHRPALRIRAHGRHRLCVPDFYFSDAHFSHNIVPGDGMNFSYRVCVGQKRAAYMAYMEPKIDAKTALEWGLINEIVEHDDLIPRAYEIANHIMKSGRRRPPPDPRARHAPVEARPAGRRTRPRSGRDVRRRVAGHSAQLRQDRCRLPGDGPQHKKYQRERHRRSMARQASIRTRIRLGPVWSNTWQEKILIVGTGTMGEGIAQTFAQNGFDVRLVARREEPLARALSQIKQNVQQFIEFDLITETVDAGRGPHRGHGDHRHGPGRRGLQLRAWRPSGEARRQAGAPRRPSRRRTPSWSSAATPAA